MVVSIPPDGRRQIGEVQLPQQPPGNPETDFVTLKSEIITKDEAKGSLARLLGQSREKEAFVFVHGFNNRYEDAVYRFAQILHDSEAAADVAPILFTWPSAGNVFAYNYDRDSANYSRDDLEKLLRYLQDDPQVKTISILAHSMGNWVTLEALRQMAIRDGRVVPKVKVVMLADADVDVDIAREQIATLGPERPHIVLFVNEKDRALAASKDIWEAPRLGAIDPEVEPYKSMVEQDQLSVINMTHMPSHDFFNHGKYAEDPRVVELIGRRLAAGQVLTDHRVGLGARIMAGHVGCGRFVRARRRSRHFGPRRRRRSRDARSLRRPGRQAQTIPCDASARTDPSEGAGRLRMLSRSFEGDVNPAYISAFGEGPLTAHFAPPLPIRNGSNRSDMTRSPSRQ